MHIPCTIVWDMRRHLSVHAAHINLDFSLSHCAQYHYIFDRDTPRLYSCSNHIYSWKKSVAAFTYQSVRIVTIVGKRTKFSVWAYSVMRDIFYQERLTEPPNCRWTSDESFAKWYHFRFSVLQVSSTWCRHQMETFSALLAICAGNSPVTGEFPTQRPVTRNFDVLFDLRVNKRLSKQSRGW